MVKKISEMIPPFQGNGGGGGGGGGDDDEDEEWKRGAYGGGDRIYLNGSIRPKPQEEEEEEIGEDAREGTHLYLNFLQNQINDEGIYVPPGIMPNDDLDTLSLTHERLMDWTRAGRELRLMADAFARSPERESVRLRAQKVSGNIDVLDFDNFFKLLQELFQEGGVTRERILVLFFFCADVALEALRKGYKELFSKLVSWSISYISTRVSQWVHNNGGWSVVLQSSLNIAYQVSACAAFVAVVCACVVYIRRNV